MKKIIVRLSVVAVLVTFLTGCGASYPVLTTDNPVGTKIGEAGYKRVLGFIITNNGDASVQSAAENGGIKKISTIDYEVRSGFFTTRYKTIVTGE